MTTGWPYADLDIRGTIVLVTIQANNGPVRVESFFDPLTGQVGEVIAWARGNLGNVLARLSTDDRALVFTPGANLQIIVTEAPRTTADQLAAQDIVQQVVAIHTAFNANPIIPGQPSVTPPTDPGQTETSPGGSNIGGSQGGGGGSGTSQEALPNLAGTDGTQPTLVATLTPPSTFVVPTNTTITTTITGGGGGGVSGGTPAGPTAGAPPVLSPDQSPSH